MGLDIRTPIGLLFVIVGALLVVQGLVASPSAHARTLGMNVNLWWGLVLLGFGGLMLYLGRRGQPRAE